MITKKLLVLRKHILTLSILYTLVLTAASLFKLEGIPEIVPTQGDKIFHFIAYAILTLFWFNSFYYVMRLKRMNALFVSVISAIIFGILIEVLQGTITNDRTSEINDIIANSLGVFIAAVLILIKPKTEVKKE